MNAPSLDPRPGRPRDIKGTHWFIDHPDGRVSYVILRRAEAGSPSGLTLAFEAANDAEALAAYNEWEDAQHDRTYRNAERRANWGPLGTGKMK